LARNHLAFEIDARAFLKELLGDLGDVLVKDDDAMPIGALALLAVAVGPPLVGGDAEGCDLIAVLRAAHFRIAAEVADEDGFVGHHNILSFTPPPAAAALLRAPPGVTLAHASKCRRMPHPECWRKTIQWTARKPWQSEPAFRRRLCCGRLRNCRWLHGSNRRCDRPLVNHLIAAIGGRVAIAALQARQFRYDA